MKITFERERREFSKQAVKDDRPLLWIVTVSAIILAAACIWKKFDAGLPWVGALVGLPWASHGVAVGFYFSMAKSDHSEGGITYAKAAAKNFQEDNV